MSIPTVSSLPRAFRGYQRDAVEAMVREFESQMGGLADRVHALEGELATYRTQEQTLKDAVLRAQREYDDALTDARRESERILDETRRHAAEIEEQHEARLLDLRWEIEKLQLEKKRFVSRFRSMLESQLNELTVDSAPTRAIIHAPEQIVLTEEQLESGVAASGE